MTNPMMAKIGATQRESQCKQKNWPIYIFFSDDFWVKELLRHFPKTIFSDKKNVRARTL